MKLTAFVFLFVLSTGMVSAQSWEYQQPEGPNQWGSLPGYSSCAVGLSQSPIDIESGANAGLLNVSVDTSLEELNPQWTSKSTSLTNNGHTLQVNYAPGAHLSFEGAEFDLKQFHFHSPSEHILNGRQYPLEAHFVHQSPAGTLVVGVFFQVGPSNETLEKIWRQAPAKGQSVDLVVDATRFLPQDMPYFHYQGSLTTLPCTEGVKWVVLKRPIEASVSQLQFLQKQMGGPNNRPIQPLDGRMISTIEL